MAVRHWKYSLLAMKRAVIDAKSLLSTFDFAGFIDILNQVSEGLAEPCEIVIDLSRPHFFGVSGMVPLVALVNDLCQRGWQVKIAPPQDPTLEEYWEKAGWLAGFRGEDPPAPFSKTTYTPLASYENHQQLNEQLNTVMDVLTKVTEFEQGVLRAVEWTVNEIADNVLVHAGGAQGWLQITSRPREGRIDLVVADRGPGIRATLAEAFPDLRSDTDALRRAIEQGVTRDRSIGQGNGLAGSIRIAQAAHGWVNILSGVGNLRLFDDGRFRDIDTAPYQGTVVTITLPTGLQIDLGAALWGHQPAATFEYAYVTETGLVFRVLDEATGWGNRGSGEEVATKLRNVIKEYPDEHVVIDFEGIDTPSASFLDEFLAKLIKQEGIVSFFSRFRLENMNGFVQQTAEAVIAQRLQT